MTGLARQDLKNCLDSAHKFALPGDKLGIPSGADLFRQHLGGALTATDASFEGDPGNANPVVLKGKLELAHADWDSQPVKASFTLSGDTVSSVKVEVSLPLKTKVVDSGNLHLGAGFFQYLGFTDISLVLETRSTPFAGVAAEMTIDGNHKLRMVSSGGGSGGQGTFASSRGARDSLPPATGAVDAEPRKTVTGTLASDPAPILFDVFKDEKEGATIEDLLKALHINDGKMPKALKEPTLTSLWAAYDPQMEDQRVVLYSKTASEQPWRFSLGAALADVGGTTQYVYAVESAVAVHWDLPDWALPEIGIANLGGGVFTTVWDNEELVDFSKSIDRIAEIIKDEEPLRFPDSNSQGNTDPSGGSGVGEYGQWFMVATLSKKSFLSLRGLPFTIVAAIVKSGMDWWKIDYQLGPVYLERIGFEYSTDNNNIFRFWVLVDFSVGSDLSVQSATGYRLSFHGFKIGVDPAEPSSVHVALEGAAVDVQYPTFFASAGLIIQWDQHDYKLLLEGAGTARWGSGKLASTAKVIGAYLRPADADYTSLFLYASYKSGTAGIPIIPPIEINGLCLGFGYNSTIRQPAPSKAPSFPLMISPPISLNDPHREEVPKKDPPEDALEALRTLTGTSHPWVTPREDHFWGVAGVSATVPGQINAQVVLVVDFGKGGWSVGVIGLANFTVPPGIINEDDPWDRTYVPYVKVQLAIQAQYQSANGLLAITSTVDARAHWLAAELHATGSIAWYNWLAGENRLRWIRTIGGYPKALVTIPTWFPPSLDRLRAQWLIAGGNMTVQAYCTVSSALFMVGAKLDWTWKLEFSILGKKIDLLDVGFGLFFDGAIQWNPFHLYLRIGGDIHLDIHLAFIHKRFEVGVTVDLSLPPFGARCQLHGPFGIKPMFAFGSYKPDKPPYLAWKEFAASSLPPKVDRLRALPVAGLLPSSGSPRPTALPSPDSSHSDTVANNPDPWMLSPFTMTFKINCSIPATSVSINGKGLSVNAPSSLNIRPLGPSHGTDVNAAVTVTITREGGEGGLYNGLTTAAITEALPVALWGEPTDEALDPNDPSLTDEQYITGVSFTAPEAKLSPGNPLPPISASILEKPEFLDSGDIALVPGASSPSNQRVPTADPDSITTISSSLNAQAVVSARTDLYNILDAAGYAPPQSNGTLIGYHDRLANGLYTAEPLVV